MGVVGNFVFGKFNSIPKKMYPRFSKKASVLVLLKKDFTPKFLLRISTKLFITWE